MMTPDRPIGRAEVSTTPAAVAPDMVAFVDEGLGNSSYLVDLGDGSALVVDPSRNPTPYLEAARRRGLAVRYAAETHLHADFVSGSRELAACGATIIASRTSRLEFPHRAVDDGDEIDLGGLRLRALATPGHGPEHVAYLLLDSGRPLALFSGGSLLVGAVARTDLIAPDRTEELARALWRSLHEKILVLPDPLPVYPTHGAGSFCAAPPGSARETTIARERESNPFVRATDEDAFVTLLLGSLGTYPPYFLRLREVNRRGPRIHGSEAPALPPLSPHDVRAFLAEGAILVDARPVTAFARGHVPGALSVAARPAFATWLGWLVPADQPVIFLVDPDQDVQDLAAQALKIGHERLLGHLAGGMAAWEAAGLPVARVPLIAPDAVALGAVLDVRQDAEHATGHLPGVRHVELGSLAEVAGALDEPIEVMCAHGERAMTAASLLLRAGHVHVRVVLGGPQEWATAHGRPLVAER